MLAIKAGPDFIRNLALATKLDGNPSMDGWMLEMWFFASLRLGGVDLLNESGEKIEHLHESIVRTLVIPDFPVLPEGLGVWFKPSKWNQGGFDAIYIHKTDRLVRFVQVTGGATHSFEIGHFSRFLQDLEKSQKWKPKKLEILFLVDLKQRKIFQFATTTGHGKLTKYGWKRGEETENVQIVFINGWNDY
jgi:hypothetical protein